MCKRCPLCAASAIYSNCPTSGPDLNDAWQDNPRDGRQSLHPVEVIMPESGRPGKLPDAQRLFARGGLFEFGDLVGADLMDDATQFFDARTKPRQFFLADLVML